MGNGQFIIEQHNNAYYAFSLDFPQIIVSDKSKQEAVKKLVTRISDQLLAVRNDLEALLDY